MRNTFFLVILTVFYCVNKGDTQMYWEPTSGPNGLDIADVVFTSDSILVVSAKNLGVFFSKNKGSNWQKIFKGLETQNSFARCLAAGNNGILFAIFDQTLYRLETNSDEWTKLNFSMPFNSKLFTNPQGDLYIIAPNVTILYSTDNGDNFNQIVQNVNFKGLGQALFYGNGNNFLAVLEGGGAAIYRLNDDGKNLIKLIHLATIEIFWHTSGYLFGFTPSAGIVRMDSDGTNQFWKNPFPTSIKKLAMNSDGNILVFTDDGDYESEDLGLNYKKNQTKLFERIENKSEVYFFKDEIFIYNYNCNTGEFEKTEDSGKNWISLEKPFTNSLVKDLFIDDLGRLFAKTCNLGKYSYSLDGGNTWQFLRLPSDIRPCYDLVSSGLGNLFIIMDSKLYKSSDLGKNWTPLNLASGNNFIRLKGVSGNRIFAFGFSASFYSKDGGNIWSPVANTPTSIDKLYFHPDGTIFAVSYDQLISGLYYSEDEGLNWNSVKTEFVIIDGFCISNTGKIYISGSPIAGTGTYVSYDKLNSITRLKPDIYKSLLTDDKGVLYGTLESKCDKSIDDGKSWINFQSGLPVYRNYNSLAIDKQGHLFIGMDNDVVYKTINSVTANENLYNDIMESELILKPNPVIGILNVRIFNENINNGHYRIFDQKGSLMLENQFDSQYFNIDCSKLINGLAFIQIFSDKSLQTTIHKILICNQN